MTYLLTMIMVFYGPVGGSMQTPGYGTSATIRSEHNSLQECKDHMNAHREALSGGKVVLANCLPVSKQVR